MTNKIVIHNKNLIHVSLCVFCLSWLNNGFVAQIPMIGIIPFLGIFGLWLYIYMGATSFKLEIKNKWFLIYLVSLLISSIFHNKPFNKFTYGTIYLGIILLFFTQYSKSQKAEDRKVIIYYYLFENIVMALKTIYISLIDPLYVRTVTAGVETNIEYNGFMVAKFDNIYVFSILAVFFILIANDTKNKFAFYSMALIYMTCVYLANFATAFLISLMFILLIFLFKSPKKVILFTCVSGLLIFLLKPYVAHIALKIGSSGFLSPFMSKKLIDIYDVFSGTTGNNMDNTWYIREQYSRDAIKVFFNHPFIGVYGRGRFIAENNLLRDHNVWFDFMASFGILRAFPFLMFLSSWYKKIIKKVDLEKKAPYSLAFILWILFGMFNPLNKSSMHIMLFVFMPFMISEIKDNNI